MKTYGYRFSASGKAEDILPFTEAEFENTLRDSPDCLGTYCIFPSDSDILESASFGIEGDDVTSVTIRTYTELYEGSEDDLKECVACCLAEAAPSVAIKGDVEAMGMEGDVSDVLYHITERANLESIQKDGIIPANGKNHYKDDSNHIYLAERKDLAAWMCIIPHLDDPVILEVDAAGLDIQPGRHFSDRPYLDKEGYGEYRTSQTVPAEAVKEVPLDGPLGTMIGQAVKVYQERDNGSGEPARGMARLEKAGYMDIDDLPFADDEKELERIGARRGYSMDFGDLPWEKETETPKTEPYRYRFDVGYAKPGMPMDNQMAPYESGRMEDAIKGTGTNGIEAVRFEQEPDGAVKHVSIYTKGPWNPDKLENHMEKAVSLFNRQSDDVRIELEQGISCGRSKVEEYSDSFSDAVARIKVDNETMTK